MGCYGSGSCSAVVTAEVIPYIAPTTLFPYYTEELTETNNALKNYESVCAEGCYGDVMTFSACEGSTSDTYFRLFLDSRQVAKNDDACSVASEVVSLYCKNWDL